MRRKVAAILAVMAVSVGVLALTAPAASANDEPEFIDECPPPWFPINTVIGGPGNDVLNGTPCDDRLLGRGGNDVLRGRGGEDVLGGGAGNDRLNGAETLGLPQPDTLRGGRGFDTCVIDFLDDAYNCEVVIEVDPF